MPRSTCAFMSTRVSLACFKNTLRTAKPGSFPENGAEELGAILDAVNPETRGDAVEVVVGGSQDAGLDDLAGLHLAVEQHHAVDLGCLLPRPPEGTALVVDAAGEHREHPADRALVGGPRDLALQTHETVPALLLDVL